MIGKPRKAWGRLVSLRDPEPDQHEQKTIKGKGIAGRGHRSSKRVWHYVGSLEPLCVVGAEAEAATTAVCVVGRKCQ